MASANAVGILAMEVYFPSTYVKQTDLEVAYGASAGKFTIGLGQEAMAFTGDREDINSIALTVVKSLIEKYDIKLTDIGRLEVGTESVVDKSKSTKTVLMSLFEGSGNTDIEGATVINACYGGTSALFNALLWADSSAWDGRYAIVVAADIAVYSEGPARPSGGCGAVAMLIGRNAPIAIDLCTRVTHATHVWDFFKPKMESEYPCVNGALSQTCYLTALDDCYTRFVQKVKTNGGKMINCDSVDFFLFHSPYNKLVQKSFGRLMYLDALGGHGATEELTQWLGATRDSTFEDKDLEATLKTISKEHFAAKVLPACVLSKQIGNTYTASVYMNLANLISSYGPTLLDKTVTLFSYGSGALASMFEIIPRACGGRFTLEKMQRALSVEQRLASRIYSTPELLSQALLAREVAHSVVPFQPTFPTDGLWSGTYYLKEITANYERIYERKPLDVSVAAACEQSEGDYDDYVNLDISESENESDSPSETLHKGFASKLSLTSTTGRSAIPRNSTYVWASGRPNVSVVVTGVAAAVPGRYTAAFKPGVDSIQRIIAGENFITPIPSEIKDQMIARNVVELVKGKDGKMNKVPIRTHEEGINLCAAMGEFDLTSYGVSESIVSTMDRSVQVAVAAGLEALKDAGIVTGEGPGLDGWVLPAHFQNSTGIVYATSFPALDTAIGEVSKYFLTKTVDNVATSLILSTLRQRLEAVSGAFSQDCEKALSDLATTILSIPELSSDAERYEFDRKFLFRVLVLGNAQLAQIVKARGPNMQTNAACAGATQAVALAYDMIQVGRAERMIVIAGDNASSDNLMPWLGNGFRALGAATKCAQVAMACLPFDSRRTGMILGSGGIGMVLESEEGANRRYALSVSKGIKSSRAPYRCRLLGTLISNSAFHGASMDAKHIAEEMERFISSMEQEHGISRAEIARNGVYFSHETSTHASPTASCAFNEIQGLRSVFKENLQHLLICNTKGFTGHPMGVSFEDVVLAEVLVSGMVPPIANSAEPDPYLGSDLKLSRGGSYPCKFALRFAAGFGSQIALALYGKS